MEPKLSHVILTTLLGLGCILSGLLMPSSNAVIVVTAFGVLFVVLAVVIVIWINGREQIARYDSASRFADKLAALDPDQYMALGIRFPMLQIRWSGQPITCVEDSGVALKHFRAFLEDSDYRQVAPERNWASREKPRSVWRKIMNWLDANEYIYRDSAAGSHSWLWRGSSHKILNDRYIFPHIRISRLHGDDDVFYQDHPEPGVAESGVVVESGVLAA